MSSRDELALLWLDNWDAAALAECIGPLKTVGEALALEGRNPAGGVAVVASQPERIANSTFAVMIRRRRWRAEKITDGKSV